jgi:hypothetical protein
MSLTLSTTNEVALCNDTADMSLYCRLPSTPTEARIAQMTNGGCDDARLWIVESIRLGSVGFTLKPRHTPAAAFSSRLSLLSLLNFSKAGLRLPSAVTPARLSSTGLAPAN